MTNLNQYDIRYDRAIMLWDEALPIGNGRLGALLYGDGPVHLSLDRVDLWDTRPNPTTLESDFCYENLVKYSTSGKKEDWEERERLFERIYSGKLYPSKITAGRLELDFGCKLQDVKSRVDIQEAVAQMCFDDKRIEAFMSATRYIGAAKLQGSFSWHIHIPNYLQDMGYPKTKVVSENGFTYYKQETATDFSYGIVLYHVKKENHTELYFTVATTADAEDFIAYAKELLLDAAKTGYEVLKEEHTDWWKDYWKQSHISVGDELLEKVYYRSWYLFASGSRKGSYPMPLQGVWTADDDKLPPWKGDYHHDTNTQLSYQAYLKANHLPEGEAFIDYLWKLKPKFEKVAREFYHVEGLLIPGVSTIDGKPMGGWSQYALSPTMSIWAAQSFDEYYLYTGDEDFLREKAFPFLAEVEQAIKGLLVEKEGKLYLQLSTSPEIHDATPQAYLKPNSNFDLALMRYLYTRLIDYCKILGKETTEYEELLSKFDEIALIDGYIGLNAVERLQESHRHFSHLMCLYPLHLINYDTDEHKEIYRKTIYDLERLGTGFWVGFSYAMCAQIYAMAEHGNSAYEKLRQFADGFVGDNGFHLNGDFRHKGYSTYHYRPFTLESQFGYCDALHEMLLQDHQGYLHVFPAIPDDWREREIAFTQLRSRNGVLVSACMSKGVLKEIVLDIPKKQTIRVKNGFAGDELVIKTENGSEVIDGGDGYIDLELPQGRTYMTVKERN